MLIPRDDLMRLVRSRLKQYPVVTLLGARQCGKTTLAHQLAGDAANRFFDMERPADQARLASPMTALEPLRGLVIIDEAHLRPDLLPILRVLADRPRRPARFLLLGSASPELIRNASESLAGRTALVQMGGFSVREVGGARLRQLWVRGAFPRSFLARTQQESLAWRDDFIQTFVERDLRSFGVNASPAAMRRFWTMTAHYHGQTWNGAEIARSLGDSHTTVRRYLDIFTGAYMTRQLQPWFENLGKRIVKSPKVYIRDSGLAHALLGLGTFSQLESHPKLGASWEGFVIEQIIGMFGERNAWFWGTQAGAELDLLLTIAGRKWGIEVKYTDAPSMTRSMHIALDDLKLQHLWTIYPGKQRYALSERVTALPVAEVERLREIIK